MTLYARNQIGGLLSLNGDTINRYKQNFADTYMRMTVTGILRIPRNFSGNVA